MTISEHITSTLPSDFAWGEPGDILWEAREAGWADAVALAYERGKRAAVAQARDQAVIICLLALLFSMGLAVLLWRG